MKKILLVVVAVAAITACGKTIETPENLQPGSPESTGIMASAPDFLMGAQTKTSISQTGTDSPAFAWKEGDVIGVVPMNAETVQSNYRIKEIGQNPRQASFDGGVWALKEGKAYAAYYPFQKQAAVSNESVEISFMGQKQSGNGSLDHLGDYDVMYASSITPENGSACFEFKHLVSLVRLQLSLPAGTYSNVLVESNLQGWFAMEAALDLSNGKMTASSSSSFVDIGLDDIVLESDGVLEVWFATVPTDLLNNLKVNVFATCKSCEYRGTAGPFSTLEAGMAYSYSIDEMTQIPGREYVDLGLPSGTMWATCNVGAENPEDAGYYFQWAGTQDVSDCGINVDWGIYPYHVSGGFPNVTLSKYVNSGQSMYWGGEGNPDEKFVLDSEDDAANCQWGFSWHIPTSQQWTELINNCDFVWTADYNASGKSGYLVTSRVAGYESRQIFLPAAGNRDGIQLMDKGGCYYWSSVWSEYYTALCAVCFRTSNLTSKEYQLGGWFRKLGLSVRPVF